MDLLQTIRQLGIQKRRVELAIAELEQIQVGNGGGSVVTASQGNTQLSAARSSDVAPFPRKRISPRDPSNSIRHSARPTAWCQNQLHKRCRHPGTVTDAPAAKRLSARGRELVPPPEFD